MNCPLCDSQHSTNLMFERAMQRKQCLDCKFTFYDSVEYYENEPDMAILGGGNISLRRFFCLKNDVSVGVKFSFVITKNDCKLIYDNEGSEVVTLKSGGLGIGRNANLVLTIRAISKIKKGQSAFFKLRKIKNGFKMEEIDYNNLAKRRKINKSKEKSFLTLVQSNLVRFSKGAVLLLDLANYKTIRAYTEDGKLFISPSLEENGFPIKITDFETYSDAVFCEYLREYFSIKDKKRLSIIEVEKSINNSPIYQIIA